MIDYAAVSAAVDPVLLIFIPGPAACPWDFYNTITTASEARCHLFGHVLRHTAASAVHCQALRTGNFGDIRSFAIMFYLRSLPVATATQSQLSQVQQGCVVRAPVGRERHPLVGTVARTDRRKTANNLPVSHTVCAREGMPSPPGTGLAEVSRGTRVMG